MINPPEFCKINISLESRLTARVRARERERERGLDCYCKQTHTPLLPAIRGRTCVLQDESIAAQGGVAAEGQEERVGAALDAVGYVGAVKAPQQGAQGVGPVVNVQEVIAGLQAEPGTTRGR